MFPLKLLERDHEDHLLGIGDFKDEFRLQRDEPVVETPARPFAGAGPGSDEEDAAKEPKEPKEAGETVPASTPVASVEAALAAESARTDDEKDGDSAAQKQSPIFVSDSEMPEAPTKDPAAVTTNGASNAPVTPAEPTLMGVNCGRRSLRDMLWGSIPESGLGDDEDEPKAPPKGLLNKSYSIKEEDESEHEDGDETHEEGLESSENADESFEFMEDKGRDTEKGDKPKELKEPEATKEPDEKEEAKPNENEKEPEKKASEKEETETVPQKEQKPAEDLTEPVAGDTATKVTLVTFNTSSGSEAAPQKTDDADKEPSASRPDQPSYEDKPETKEEPARDSAPENPSTEMLAEQAAVVMTSTASFNQPAESNHEKPHLTRQEKLPSSGNLVAQAGDDIVVRVGVPLFDAAPDSKPAEAEPTRVDSNEESTASPSSDGAVSAAPLSDEVTHDLHLKLTPILRSLETDEPNNAADDDGERAPKSAPSEDRKGTVPPNTPAVVEDREGLLGADEAEPGTEPVSVPKVVSYYESISPRGSPAPSRPRDAETSAVPKVIKFAVPMEPEKIYLSGQEPEEMEDTPIPCAAEPAPEPAALRQQTEVLIPVRATPDDLDPLSALAASETATQQPSAPEEKSDGPVTPSTTPEDAATDPAQNTAPAEADGDQQKVAPPVYKPELFEPEPKRPLILTSEMVDEDAPPYEPGVHDARTLPLGRKTAVVTEQPPPFGDDDRSDPRDPFLPDHPRPGAAFKDDGWLTTCFDLCCCCWAP